MTKRLGLALTTSQALGILGLVMAMFFLSTERWTALPISDALAADLQLVHPATEFRDWDSVDNQCVEAIKSLEALNRPRGPIPHPGPDPGPLVIGCNLADCGPGTDGPGPIDLRITLTGDLVENTILEFENMTVQEAARIGVRGNAGYVKGTTRFEVRSGTTVLRGFRTNPELRPPVAIPHLNLNREALEAFKQAATVDNLLANSKSSVILVIEQFRGRMDVNEYKMLYIFQHCPPFEPLPIPTEPMMLDFVDFGTVAPSNKVTILAPGRVSAGSAGCNDYNAGVVTTGATPGTTISLYNHRKDEEVGPSPNQCHSEVVVYSKSNALAVVQPVSPAWTDAAYESVPVGLRDPLEVPVTVWILVDDPTKSKEMMLTNSMTSPITTATTIYTNAMCGITFDDTPTIHSVNADIPPGKELEYLSIDPPRGESIMKADCPGLPSCFYTAGSLNVYLVENLQDGAVGFTSFSSTYGTCAQGTISCDRSGDMIFLSESYAYDTLAHEFGHALELDGTDGIDGLSNQNLMWEYSRGGDSSITKGQCYRANVDSSSYVNTDAIRPFGSPTHSNCPRNGDPSNVCPELSFDHP